MDREKVIEAIENCIGQPKCKDCPWEDCEVEHEVVNSVPYGLMRDAITLLKEQEAVKPTWSRGKPFCGACGLRIHGGKFCGECGRPVLWGGR